MPKIASILLITAVLAGSGCRDDEDPGGDPAARTEPAHAPAQVADSADRTPVDPLAPAVGVEPAAEPEPLSQELSRFFRLIQAKDPGARVRLRKYLNRNPDDGRAEFLFGLSYHEEKSYALARPWYEQAIQHAPEYGQTYHFYGWCLYYLGDPDLARRAFETHLRFEPDESDSHFALGLIALDADELDEADRRIRRAIALSKDLEGRTRDLAKAKSRLADVLIRNGDFEAARVELEESAALHPDLYETQYKLFRVLSRLGEHDAAKEAQARFIVARQKMYPTTSFPE